MRSPMEKDWASVFTKVPPIQASGSRTANTTAAPKATMESAMVRSWEAQMITIPKTKNRPRMFREFTMSQRCVSRVVKERVRTSRFNKNCVKNTQPMKAPVAKSF
jgi:hypothetical protein